MSERYFSHTALEFNQNGIQIIFKRTVSAVVQVNSLFAFTISKIWSLNYRMVHKRSYPDVSMLLSVLLQETFQIYGTE